MEHARAPRAGPVLAARPQRPHAAVRAAPARARTALRTRRRRGAAPLRNGRPVRGAFVVAALAAGSLLLQRVLRRRLDAASTALTLGVALLGTFALDLLARMPLASAAAAFALAALALWMRERTGGPFTARALLIGGAAGLAAVWHPPNAALALLALPRRGEGVRPLALALGATAALWAAARTLGLAAPLPSGPWQPLLALFGSRQGLLYLTPALWLGVWGLALMLRRDARDAAPLAAAVLAMIALHAACPFGPAEACPREQLAALVPLLALPAGLALGAVRECVRRAPAAPLWAAAALLVCSNLLFMQQYATDMIPRDFPVPFAEVAQNQAALVARAVGSPLSWPASWIFAARHHTGVARFDAAAGKRLDRAPDGAVSIDVGRLDSDEALLLEGWSVRHPCGEAVCRAVEGRARLLVPVPDDAPLEVAVQVVGGGAVSAEVGPARSGLRAITLRVVAPHASVLVDRVIARPLTRSAPQR